MEAEAEAEVANFQMVEAEMAAVNFQMVEVEIVRATAFYLYSNLFSKIFLTFDFKCLEERGINDMCK